MSGRSLSQVSLCHSSLAGLCRSLPQPRTPLNCFRSSSACWNSNLFQSQFRSLTSRARSCRSSPDAGIPHYLRAGPRAPEFQSISESVLAKPDSGRTDLPLQLPVPTEASDGGLLAAVLLCRRVCIASALLCRRIYHNLS